MKYLNIARFLALEAIPKYSLKYLTILLLTTLSVTPAALAQTVLDPGNVEVFFPDNNSVDDQCGTTATCGTSVKLSTVVGAGAGEAGAFAFVGGTTDSDLIQNTLTRQFTVPTTTDSDIVLDARITGKSSWRGTLFVVDFTKIVNTTIPSLGIKAEAFIRAGLVDITDPDPANHFEVGNTAVADFGCGPDRTAGTKIPIPLVSDGVEFELELDFCEEDRNDTFSFGAKVITGHTYELQMAIICHATTGVPLSIFSGCTFNPTDISFNLQNLIGDDLTLTTPDVTLNFGISDVTFPGIDVDFSSVLKALSDVFIPEIDDGFMRWDYMAVTIDEDVPSLVRSGVSEALRLLHTPSGRRQTSGLVLYPSLCADGDCDWPER